MRREHTVDLDVRGPWSLATSRRFWEGFAPAALPEQADDGHLRTVFRVEGDWTRAEADVTQETETTRVVVRGDGDLDAAAEQVARFLALDLDATTWPDVGRRDPVVGDVQERLPGLRPCGFHSPYEAAAWAVLSQRVAVPQAARMRAGLVERHGDDGAFPAPARLRELAPGLDLPGRKAEYLGAVADAALAGRLDTLALRALDPDEARREVAEIHGLGPFAADLVVLRGANVPDAVPTSERRLRAIVAERYPGRDLDEVAGSWRPWRTWGSFHLRAAFTASLEARTA
ncbi:DNA-3-methyladenine glycosylase [Luteimicrobium xylanilyticum]|uniref:DNA-3-methyladenine glycosylase II n=1 Tax=Luteimicrobium xylanilyticum TaxID=1133546 RepID=A0A5P9QFU3_9MICO|nr:DNA-3-methyladenine glycosylase [Luteimicrobium xylanilyticum]QFU99952.1 DNA-3-methyladenine glycosylase II [Luteimicrobium xylanilyticum]